MEITEVKVFPVREEKLKAFVSVVFDRCFMVNDIKIIQGRDGLFVSMPSRKKKNGEFKDVAHPLNNETRRMIELEVVDEYERVLAERGESLPAPPRTFGDPEEEAAERPASAAAPGGGSGANGSEPVAAAGPAPEREEAAQDRPAQERPVEERPAAAASAEGSAPRAAASSGDEARAAGDGGAEGRKKADKEAEDKSLEEVQEMHLRDSFWSVS